MLFRRKVESFTGSEKPSPKIISRTSPLAPVLNVNLVSTFGLIENYFSCERGKRERKMNS